MSVGGRVPLDREYGSSADSGHGSWGSGDAEAAPGEPQYTVVMTGDAWTVIVYGTDTYI